MDPTNQLFNPQIQFSVPALFLGLVAGAVAFIVFVGLLIPQKGKPTDITTVVKSLRNIKFKGLQARLDEAQMDVSALEYIKRSLMLGIPVGLGLALLIGSVVMFGVGIFAGFMITWTKLEQERDTKVVTYTKQLASACDTIRTAYGVNPSLKKALEAVAEFGLAPVKDDFREILIAAGQERFVEGLQAVAERRRSIVFDTVATSLVRASEASGEVNDMLARLADSTRQNVGAFEDAITSQLNARSAIQWGTYGPWMIFCGFRVIATLMALSASGGGPNVFGGMSSFFTTPGGNLLSLSAALISIFVYRNGIKVSQRGLVVRRVAISAPQQVRVGQKPLTSQGQSEYSAQTRPVTVNYEVDHA
jgi:Type II secretion system (T2SS), protein F